jgi:hypothetical protein
MKSNIASPAEEALKVAGAKPMLPMGARSNSSSSCESRRDDLNSQSINPGEAL